MASRDEFSDEDSLGERNPRALAIDLLVEARMAAETRGRDVWDFAVELPLLIDAGMTLTLLRALVCDAILEPAQEITSPRHKKRRFRRMNNLCFTQATCFVLCKHQGHLISTFGESAKDRPSSSRMLSQSNVRPHWDREARTLTMHGRVVKRFRVPAKCQEIILRVFEEVGWPTSIDDPLSPVNGEDPKYRLHNTIKALNRHHLVPLLHFTGNGTGHRVHWEHTAAVESYHRPCNERL